MNDDASVAVLAAFVVFSRIGACLLLMPGFSSPRVPVQVRLYIAVAVSLALTPLQFDIVRPLLADGQPLHLLRLMGSEMFTGAAIGIAAGSSCGKLARSARPRVTTPETPNPSPSARS